MRRWCTLPAMTSSWLPGVHPSANIQGDPDLYEIENRAADPKGRIEQAMWQIAPWQDDVLLDLGAGTGFHLERLFPESDAALRDRLDELFLPVTEQRRNTTA
jgi:hypothetical protein